MNRSSLLMMAIAASVALSGCVQTKYSWGKYDTALYSYYQDGGKAADYQTALEGAIKNAEVTNKPVAPGLYAEYGYLLMQQKRDSEAVAYFEKEKKAWPESSRFMDGMIKMASDSAKPVAAIQTDAAGKAQ
jgi:hypothetical protein